jgi:hypothetical protein
MTAIMAAALHAAGSTLVAQDLVRPDSTVRAGGVVGSVVAAQTGAPLDGALVMLEPAPGGALPARGGGPPFWEAARVARTDASGAYRFHSLAVGRYRLLVRRLGYHPTSLEIDLRGHAAFRVSVGLVVLPIALEPVAVPGGSTTTSAAFRTDGDEAERARLMTEADRRSRFLASDARTLTGIDLTEAVTLAESDLFRALQRLPSVATRDDFTAELWTRGARWSDTRVTFDGYPLFSPVHVAGAFSGVDPDAVGSAFFHPGVRPASSGEGAAATLALTSRPATEPGLHGLGELSMVSARAALARGARDGRGGWMVAGRRSYADFAAALLAALQGDSTVTFPYAFTDMAARVDVPLGGSRAVEVSGLWAEDALRGTLPDLLRASQGRWGNAMLRATLVAPLAGLAARHTAGVSRFDVGIEPSQKLVPGVDDQFDVPSHIPTQSAITYAAFGGQVAPQSGDSWAAGYEFVSQRLRYAGSDATQHPDRISYDTLRFTGATSLLALWGERRWRPRARLTALAGLRVEVGTPLAGAPRLRIAPRFQARHVVGNGGLALSAGYGRSFQYTQAVGATGPGVGPELHVSEVWVMAGDTIPAIRSDIATVGAEYWMGDGWIAALTLYGRWARGVAVPDPTPGPMETVRPLFVPAANASRGAELLIRKLTGRWTGSIALSTSRSELSARGYRYPAAAERRRVLHGAGLLRLSHSVRVGGALTAASGSPFTRFVAAQEVCDSTAPTCPPTWGQAPYVESPNGARARGYATVDLLLAWSHAYRGWSLAASLQLRNALNATGPVTYTGSVDGCGSPQPPLKAQVRPGLCDHYAGRLPLLPLVGLRVAF